MKGEMLWLAGFLFNAAGVCIGVDRNSTIPVAATLLITAFVLLAAAGVKGADHD